MGDASLNWQHSDPSSSSQALIQIPGKTGNNGNTGNTGQTNQHRNAALHILHTFNYLAFQFTKPSAWNPAKSKTFQNIPSSPRLTMKSSSNTSLVPPWSFSSRFIVVSSGIRHKHKPLLGQACENLCD